MHSFLVGRVAKPLHKHANGRTACGSKKGGRYHRECATYHSATWNSANVLVPSMFAVSALRYYITVDKGFCYLTKAASIGHFHQSGMPLSLTFSLSRPLMRWQGLCHERIFTQCGEDFVDRLEKRLSCSIFILVFSDHSKDKKFLTMFVLYQIWLVRYGFKHFGPKSQQMDQ